MKYLFFRYTIVNLSPRLTTRYPDSRGSCIRRSVCDVLCLYWHLVQTRLNKIKNKNTCDSQVLNSLFNYVSKVLSSKLSIKHQVLKSGTY